MTPSRVWQKACSILGKAYQGDTARAKWKTCSSHERTPVLQGMKAGVKFKIRL